MQDQDGYAFKHRFLLQHPPFTQPPPSHRFFFLWASSVFYLPPLSLPSNVTMHVIYFYCHQFFFDPRSLVSLLVFFFILFFFLFFLLCFSVIFFCYTFILFFFEFFFSQFRQPRFFTRLASSFFHPAYAPLEPTHFERDAQISATLAIYMFDFFFFLASRNENCQMVFSIIFHIVKLQLNFLIKQV